VFINIVNIDYMKWKY